MSLQSCRMEISDEIFIAAPPHRVWQLLRHIGRWQQWTTLVRVLSARPAMHPTRFCWKASGIRFHSHITAERPTRTLQWKSIARGIVAERSWMLVPEGAGTRVITYVDAEGVLLCIRPEATRRLARLRNRQMLAELRAAAESARERVLN